MDALSGSTGKDTFIEWSALAYAILNFARKIARRFQTQDNLVPRVFVPLDQQSENKSSGSNHRSDPGSTTRKAYREKFSLKLIFI